MELFHPAFAGRGIAAVGYCAVESVDVAAGWRSVVPVGELEREFVLGDAELVRWEEVPRVVVLWCWDRSGGDVCWNIC